MTEAVAAPETETPRQARPVLRQLLRLTRTEFTLLRRYNVATFYLVFPLFLLIPAWQLREEEILPGMNWAVFLLAGSLALMPGVLALLHVANVYTARRELLILKRLRVSGVPPVAMFGATTVSVLVGSCVAIGATVVILGTYFDAWPQAPVLVALSVVLLAVTLVLLAIAFTRLTRNAESAQMAIMGPFLALLFTSGATVPLQVLPDAVATVLRLLPWTAAFEVAASGYLGYDLVGGIEGAEATTGLSLWTAAAPWLGVLLVWLAVAVYLLRFVRWDPREAS